MGGGILGMGSAMASSSSTKVEDMDLEGTDQEKMKGRSARKIIRAKRYNRKKREEWPPPGWIPIWEEERPRIWGEHEIPDEVATGEVYDHLKRRFDLKSAGICAWLGCKPADPDNPEYKMLKRHVETVHLGLKLVCQLCGMCKCTDNHRKATHKHDCLECDHEKGEPVVVPEELCHVQDDHQVALIQWLLLDILHTMSSVSIVPYQVKEGNRVGP